MYIKREGTFIDGINTKYAEPFCQILHPCQKITIPPNRVLVNELHLLRFISWFSVEPRI